jgi:hypothetical protein
MEYHNLIVRRHYEVERIQAERLAEMSFINDLVLDLVDSAID